MDISRHEIFERRCAHHRVFYTLKHIMSFYNTNMQFLLLGQFMGEKT